MMAGINRDRNAFLDMSQTERMLSNLITFAKVIALDETKAKVKVKAGEICTTWLNVTTLRAGEDRHWWLPEVGEQVVVLAPSGDLNQGVVIGSIFSEGYPPNDNKKTKHTSSYQDGAVFAYDREEHHYRIQLPEDGKLTITMGDSALLIDGKSIRLKSPRIDLN
jgi:phage baseplate assembly protein V